MPSAILGDFKKINSA